ncbi:MAG: TRAP transporter small permease subunit [Sneathiella sp.]|nr:TRAP transporter small permease subunit [Sneathiella sp.]
MRRIIVSLSDGIHLVVRRAAVLTVTLMFLAMAIQIVARYAFSAPPIWTEDVARYMMVWSGLLGATLSFKSHSDAVLMESVFPKRPYILGLLAEGLQTAAILTFIGPVIYFCFIGLRGGFAKGYLARQAALTVDTLGIPMAWIALAVPLSFLIILVHLLARWADRDAT